MQQSIQQVKASIRQNMGSVITDLATAQNEVLALLGQPALPTQPNIPEDATVPGMVQAVQVEFHALAAACEELAEYVHGWTTGPAVPPEVQARMHATARKIVEEATRPQLAADPEPIPEPVNAPTLAGGITQPTRIDAADLNAATTSGPEDNPADDVQPTKEEWEAAYPTTDPQPEPEPQPTPEPDGGSEELDAAPGNRVAHLLNGHVEPGKELATVLGATEPEESGGGKKGRNRRKK